MSARASTSPHQKIRLRSDRPNKSKDQPKKLNPRRTHPDPSSLPGPALNPNPRPCHNTVRSPIANRMNNLKQQIREIPDFPKPGILFYDITTLLKDAEGLKSVIDGLSANYHGQKIDTVVGIEARGFIFAPAVAYALGAGFVPVRKPGKLPAAAERVEYQLEYGTDILEVHRDAVHVGNR